MNREPRIRSARVGTVLHLAVGGAFLAAAVVVVLLTNHTMRQHALQEAESKAMLLLDRNLATHHYFNQHLKPNLFAWSEPFRDPAYFDPVWMSSTYAVREIDRFFRDLTGQRYYYKECAVGARSPENEADAYERAFLSELNADPALTSKSAIRRLDGQLYYVLLRRGEVMEEACLRCHGTPARAPSSLVEIYGDERSFGRSVGQVVSAISIRVPLSAAYAGANRFSMLLSGLLLLGLAALFALQLALNRSLVLVPLARLQAAAVRISGQEGRPGERIPLPRGRELREVTEAFNAMSARLHATLEGLEELVATRTAELQEVNRQLARDIDRRERLEAEREKLIGELREALARVKRLSGLLPICAHCKRIRDDRGYWNQLEAYISTHSEAEFSHGLCPDCVARYYPEAAGGEEPAGPS